MSEIFPPDPEETEVDADLLDEMAAVEATGTMADVYERHGSRPLGPDEIKEFEELADHVEPYLPPVGEG